MMKTQGKPLYFKLKKFIKKMCGGIFSFLKLAHNGYVLAKAACRNFQFRTNCPAAFANTMLAAGAVI